MSRVEALQIKGLAESSQEETLGFQPGTIGIYSPGALGVSMAYHLGITHFITREGGRSALLFPSQATLNVVADSQPTPITATVSHGLVNAYQASCLPEVILACSNAD